MRTLFAALAFFALLSPAPARADASAVHEALEAYALYQHDVSVLLDLEVNSAGDVNAALARLTRHNPARVSRGWIAYGALTAAQAPAFAAGVEGRMRREGRASVLSQLRSDVTYARREAAGSNQAIRLVLSTASADGARVEQAGARYNLIARTSATRFAASGRGRVTRVSARLTPDMRERLRIGPVAARPQRDADAFGGGRFWDTLAGRDARAPRARRGREHRDYASVTDHMLTLAALIVADGTGAERRRVSALLNEPLTQSCMEMQRLQLRQCLSVSVDVSERAYCLGRHGLSGPGGCFSNVVR